MPETVCFRLAFDESILTSPLCCWQKLVLKSCRLYNVFGSGAMHGPYSQFMMQAAIANGGKRIGLLRGAGTRFATFFYAMHRLLRQKNVLLATIHQEKFRLLEVAGTGAGSNSRVRGCVNDIEDKNFWKSLYILLRAVFPAIRFLRYCDSNTPMMDKIYTLAQRTSDAIEKSADDLNDTFLFSGIATTDGLAFEESEVFGGQLSV